ncbi:redoxin domain-containing protein [Rubripirellula reticaptiva]|uniref:AhpC/TSA family protein n=1 Tax=Rubripirellula reticaptiva TaxID=2528013 RepID=A0A5C6FB59_9BACT|nr:redoxin domain-containing protein [Rubripirellula reticaptiva]TWU58012.1 AhpC/TSA family protein [Rubripirellula reticaptiva]
MTNALRLAAFLILVAPTCTSAAKETAPASPAVGDSAPDFKLPVVGSDEMFSLSKQCDSGPVVVVVLRGFPGYQCPLCSKQVGALANRAKAIGERASRIVLVYPGPSESLEDHAAEFMGPRTLPSPIVMVRDPDMKMVDKWGLRWNAPRETAYPATFVINGQGNVAWKLVSDNHAGRSTADDVVKALKKL